MGNVMSIDSLTFRQALSNFASGVTVVTTLDPFSGKPVGVTISSFCSVSEDPPQVLFCLDKKSKALLPINANGHFAVNILASDQQDLSERFSSPRSKIWDGVRYHAGLGGVPVLTGTVTSLECKMSNEIRSGDHTIFVGQVEAARVDPGATPLIYHHNAYTELK